MSRCPRGSSCRSLVPAAVVRRRSCGSSPGYPIQRRRRALRWCADQRAVHADGVCLSIGQSYAVAHGGANVGLGPELRGENKRSYLALGLSHCWSSLGLPALASTIRISFPAGCGSVSIWRGPWLSDGRVADGRAVRGAGCPDSRDHAGRAPADLERARTTPSSSLPIRSMRPIFLADRLMIMSARPGRVQEVIPIEIERPRTFESSAIRALRRWRITSGPASSGRSAPRSGKSRRRWSARAAARKRWAGVETPQSRSEGGRHGKHSWISRARRGDGPCAARRRWRVRPEPLRSHRRRSRQSVEPKTIRMATVGLSWSTAPELVAQDKGFYERRS